MYHPELFKNKIALVTGGRSGIGYAIAKQYLELGAKVIIASRKEEPLAEAAKTLSEYRECAYKTCDIRDTAQITALVEFIKEKFGKLDILINNAGGQFPSLAENISENGWLAVINNNLNGTFFMTQAMAKAFFIPQNAGNIVNITANVLRGFPGMAHTSAARAGVENLTKSLAQEWAMYNIRINAISPGIIDSSGLDTYPKEMKSFLKAYKKENLMNRLGTVEDVANAVMFFSSPLSSYISGTTQFVDGLEHLSADRMTLFNFLKSIAK